MSKVDLDKLNKLAGLAIINDGLDVYTFRDACTPETIIDLIRELRAARESLEVIKEMKGGYLTCDCHPEGSDWFECKYMTGAYRAFEAAARVVSGEKYGEVVNDT